MKQNTEVRGCSCPIHWATLNVVARFIGRRWYKSITALNKLSNYTILCILFSVFCPLYAGEQGGRVGRLLSYGAGARSFGMGKAYTAVADDATATYWNPAGLTRLEKQNIVALRAPLWEGAIYDYVGWAYPMKTRNTLGISIARIGIGEYEQRDKLNNKIGTFAPSEAGMVIGYGSTLSDKVDAGISVKRLTRVLPDASNSLSSVDAGLLYHVNPQFDLGLKLGNIFTIKTGDTDDKMPAEMRFGAAKKLFNNKFIAALDMNNEGAFFTGIEYSIGNASLRGGWETQGVTMGMGFKISRFNLDYAASLHELGLAHRMSVGMSLGKNRSDMRAGLARERYVKGLEYTKEGRYHKALDSWGSGLQYNPEAIMIKAAKERMAKVTAAFNIRKDLSEFLKLRSLPQEVAGAKGKLMKDGIYAYTSGDVKNALLYLSQAANHDATDEPLRSFVTSLRKENNLTADAELEGLPPEAAVATKMKRVDTHFRNKQFELALKECKEVALLDPENALVHTRLGSIYFALGLQEDAKKEYGMALKLKPDDKVLAGFMKRHGWME